MKRRITSLSKFFHGNKLLIQKLRQSILDAGEFLQIFKTNFIFNNLNIFSLFASYLWTPSEMDQLDKFS